eukprot:358369-Chlamydomonas_euryale.AAC.2
MDALQPSTDTPVGKFRGYMCMLCGGRSHNRDPALPCPLVPPARLVRLVPRALSSLQPVLSVLSLVPVLNPKALAAPRAVGDPAGQRPQRLPGSLPTAPTGGNLRESEYPVYPFLPSTACALHSAQVLSNEISDK